MLVFALAGMLLAGCGGEKSSAGSGAADAKEQGSAALEKEIAAAAFASARAAAQAEVVRIETEQLQMLLETYIVAHDKMPASVDELLYDPEYTGFMEMKKRYDITIGGTKDKPVLTAKRK